MLGVAVAALWALGLFVGPVAPASADDELDAALRRKVELERAVAVARQNTEYYKSVASQYQAAVNAANQRIAEYGAKQNAAQSEAEALSFEIKIAEEQLQLVSFQMGETRAMTDSLRAQQNEIARQLQRRKSLYADHLRTSYRQLQISPLEMLLSSTSLAEFAARVQSLIFVQRQDRQLASEIATLGARAAERAGDLSTKESEILGLQDQVARQHERLAGEKARYLDLVSQAQGAIGSQAALRGQASQNQTLAQRSQQAAANETAKLNKQLEEAEAAYEDLAARQAARSGLGAFNGSKVALWPIRGPLTSGYGPRWGGFHNGLDIASPMFTTIRAASAGIVTTVGRPYVASGATAVVVIIAHGSNFSTLYGHLDDRRWPPVTVGQRINAGEVIGYVGMTGWTTGPHLHFMTIVNGRAQNPIPYLP